MANYHGAGQLFATTLETSMPDLGACAVEHQDKLVSFAGAAVFRPPAIMLP